MKKINAFGEQIKHDRELKQITIPALSVLTGLTEKELQDIEEGDDFPDVRQLITIARALGKHDGYFFTQLFYPKKKEK